MRLIPALAAFVLMAAGPPPATPQPSSAEAPAPTSSTPQAAAPQPSAAQPSKPKHSTNRHSSPRPAGPAASAPAAGTTITLAARPGTVLDSSARKLVADDLVESRQSGEKPLLLTGSAMLGSASDRPVVFVQLQSARECGSAGCSTSAFLWHNGVWKRVLDGVGGKLSILPTKTRGMSDLSSETAKYVWTGSEYRDPKGAPAVDLTPRHR